MPAVLIHEFCRAKLKALKRQDAVSKQRKGLEGRGAFPKRSKGMERSGTPESPVLPRSGRMRPE
jgi:hypothetical protein